MRTVEYQTYNEGKLTSGLATFLGFGNETDVDGIQSIAAILELADGSVVLRPAERIKFIQPTPLYGKD